MSYEPIIPDGQHLGTSHEVDGAVTGHLFEDGSNKLRGHAAWRWVDPVTEECSSSYRGEPSRELTEEERELAAQLVGLLLIVTIRAVGAATPHVKRWWNERAVPAAASAWSRVTALRRANSGTVVAASSIVERAASTGSAVGAEVASVESQIAMSSAEWMERFFAMLVAGAFKEEQQRILSNARIEDGEAASEARNMIEQLTPRQLADRIRLMLEVDPSLLDGETSAELMRVFGRPCEIAEGAAGRTSR